MSTMEKRACESLLKKNHPKFGAEAAIVDPVETSDDEVIPTTELRAVPAFSMANLLDNQVKAM